MPSFLHVINTANKNLIKKYKGQRNLKKKKRFLIAVSERGSRATVKSNYLSSKVKE